MTEREAVEKLKNMRLFMQIEDENNDCKFTEDDYKANEMAIQALEKQIVKKAKVEKYRFYPHSILVKSRYGKCPNCGTKQVDGRYCANCGQKLDWSETDE